MGHVLALERYGLYLAALGMGAKTLSDQLSTITNQPNFVELTADIVAAYVSKNSVRPADLPELIGTVHSALRGAANPAPKEDDRRKPAVDPKKSVTPDHLISLLDGRRFKSLRRHLNTHGQTPEAYKAMFGLKPDYPMVAANYAKKRSELAKELGLGQFRKAREAAAKTTGGAIRADAPKKRSRQKKA